MSLLVNGLLVNSMRWLAQWSGVWTAELDYQGEVSPSGRVVILGTTGITLSGTVDAEHSGVFGEKRFARVIAGGNGWRKLPRAQHYHSDIGLPLASIVSTTAAEVGEVAIVLAPSVVGTDFARLSTKPASQIFADADVDWWVGVDGVTRVGIRVPSVAPLSLQVLDWDPALGTVSFTCDELVEPGAIVLDTRFGMRIVRSVEATVSNGSVTGTLWLVESTMDRGTIGELAEGLAALAREATRPEFGRVYEYRVIAMQGDRVELQAVKPADGVPDLLPASIWAGVSGYKAALLPASRVLVGFIAGDPKRPYVVAYEPPEGNGWRPLTLDLDAKLAVTIGEQATAVTLGPALGAYPVARVTPTLATWIGAVTVALNTLAPASCVAPIDVASLKVVAS